MRNTAQVFFNSILCAGIVSDRFIRAREDPQHIIFYCVIVGALNQRSAQAYYLVGALRGVNDIEKIVDDDIVAGKLFEAFAKYFLRLRRITYAVFIRLCTDSLH